MARASERWRGTGLLRDQLGGIVETSPNSASPQAPSLAPLDVDVNVIMQEQLPKISLTLICSLNVPSIE